MGALALLRGPQLAAPRTVGTWRAVLLLLVNTFSQHFCLFLIVAVKGLGWCAGFLWLWQVGATFCCGVQASHCGGFSCGAQAPGTWASVLATRRLQYLWHMSLVAPWSICFLLSHCCPPAWRRQNRWVLRRLLALSPLFWHCPGEGSMPKEVVNQSWSWIPCHNLFVHKMWTDLVGKLRPFRLFF